MAADVLQSKSCPVGQEKEKAFAGKAAAAGASNPALDFLKNVPISELISKKKAASLQPDTSLTDAADFLISNGVTAVNIKADGGQGSCVHAIAFGKFLVQHTSKEKGMELSQSDLDNLQRDIANAKVSEIAEAICSADLQASSSVAELMNKMVEQYPKCNHYPIVMDASGEQVSMASMLDIVTLLFKHQDKPFATWAQQTSAKSLGLGHKPLVHCAETCSVIDVLRHMWKEQVTGVALLNNSNKLVGGFGPTDVLPLFLNNADFNLLNQPVKNYLESCERRRKPIVAPEGAMLWDVIQAIGSNHVHCVFLCSDDGAACSVVSCSDIVKAIQCSGQCEGAQ